ncbi:MAG: SGNH/GDSL hydrolase family protein [Maribacter sp.]|nr:SGNH/GDSL hydrolase family protein [Maribacter sp.]
MKRNILIVFLLACFPFWGNSQSDYRISPDVQKILFLGNSITYSGEYISFIETYLTLKYPERRIEYINVGLPSETVSGLSEPGHANGKFPRPDLKERLARVLQQTQPDLVFANYGINDGIYLPIDANRFHKFQEGIDWMHTEVVKSGARIIHLTPPIYDGQQAAIYDNVMDIYSNWLISRRYTHTWQVIDIHGPMKRQLKERKGQDSSFKFSKDGVHPNEVGHWFMAQQVLFALGEKEVSKKTTIAEAISEYPMGERVLNLVHKKQAFTKNAWLSSIGHSRPGMSEGLPLNLALEKADFINAEIMQSLKP